MLTIDDFTVVDADDKVHVHVITHCHKDHQQNVPRTGIVCATKWTLQQLPATSNRTKTVIVEPGNEYFGFMHVFETVHCTGSIGVWIPLIGYLHLGDGRITPDLLQYLCRVVIGDDVKVNVVVVDGLFYNFKELTFDSIANQVTTFQQPVYSYSGTPPRIRLHAGTCYLLSLLPDLKVMIDDDASASYLIDQLINEIVDDPINADIIVCLRKYDCVASSTLFACDRYINHQNIIKDTKGVVRICFATHASHQETRKLLDILRPHHVLFETPSHLQITQRLQC